MQSSDGFEPGKAADPGGEAAPSTGETAAPRRNVFPGLATCVVAAAAAAWISEHYGGPIVLMGLLVGLALSFIGTDERTHAGLDFVSRTCLPWGIVILGTQITLVQIGALGPAPFLALLVVMSAAFGAALLGARLSGQPATAGILAGGATAICGASAALALYGVIGRDRLSQAQFALTLVGISVASAIAMSIYPMIAGLAGMSDRQAGFLIGASIHDVAQAIGGGYAFSNEAGGYAAVVKLTRVALLAPAVMLVSLALPSPARALDGDKPRGLLSRLSVPWFIVSFFAVVVVNSLVALPSVVTGNALALSKALLLLAILATAMRSRTDLILQMGWRAAIPVAAATAASLVVALAFAILLL